MSNIDHPIFIESIQFIRSKLALNDFNGLQKQIIERIIHASGDFALQDLVRFSPTACHSGLSAIKGGALILTDTTMAACAISSMARRTFQTPIRSLLEWSPEHVDEGETKTALGMKKAWLELTGGDHGSKVPIVVAIGSAPSALQALLDLIAHGASQPSLIIGMPVGFIGVVESKNRLLKSNCPYIVLEGSRGGASLVAATVNALLRAGLQEIETLKQHEKNQSH